MSPLKPAEPLGPCWVVPVVGARETGGFGNPQSPAPLELCCQLCGQWNPSSSCRPCCAVVGSLGQLQFHPWALGGEAKLGQKKPSAPACSAGKPRASPGHWTPQFLPNTSNSKACFLYPKLAQGLCPVKNPMQILALSPLPGLCRSQPSPFSLLLYVIPAPRCPQGPASFLAAPKAF